MMRPFGVVWNREFLDAVHGFLRLGVQSLTETENTSLGVALMRLKIILAVAVITGCGVLPLVAFASGVESDATIFGKGAHAFFAGEYQKAYTQLNQAVETKTVDPRVYFFRGLAVLRMNRSEAAKVDFQKAARLEVSETNYFYDVNKALRRVQGNERLLIEQARATARVEHKKAVKKRTTRRYEATRIQEARVLRPNFPLLRTVEFQQIEPKQETPKPLETKPVPVPEISGNIRLGRLLQALGSSLGRAAGSQVPGMGMPGMGGPDEKVPAFRPKPVIDGGSPFQEIPVPKTDRGENPFQNTSYQPKPAVEFANSEGIPHNMPEPGTLVVTFPTQPDPPKTLVVDPAPSFNMLDPIPEQEPTVFEEKAVLAQVEPKVEEIEEPVEPVTEPAMPEPEALAVASTPKVEVEEPVIEEMPVIKMPVIKDEPIIENDPPLVPETVAKVEVPKHELAMETKKVEEPVEPLPIIPETSTLPEPDPAPETLAKLDEVNAKSTAIEEPKPVVTPEVPIETPKPTTKLVIKEPVVKKHVVKEPVVKAPKVSSLAMVQKAKPAHPVKTPVIDPAPVVKTPTKSSVVSKTASAKTPAEKSTAPKSTKRRIILPSGASVIPSLDLNNLPKEDDPFA